MHLIDLHLLFVHIQRINLVFKLRVNYIVDSLFRFIRFFFFFWINQYWFDNNNIFIDNNTVSLILSIITSLTRYLLDRHLIETKSKRIKSVINYKFTESTPFLILFFIFSHRHRSTSLETHEGQKHSSTRLTAEYKRRRENPPRRVTSVSVLAFTGSPWPRPRNPLSPWDTAIRMKRRGSQWRCRCRKLYSS